MIKAMKAALAGFFGACLFVTGSIALASTAHANETCWAEAKLPAEYETVTEHRLIRPELRNAAGEVARPAEYRTYRVTRIVHPGTRVPFRVMCPAALTDDFVVSLQRALAARGYYQGGPSGRLDQATRKALRAFQGERGLPSGEVALATAQILGLVPYDTNAALDE